MLCRVRVFGDRVQSEREGKRGDLYGGRFKLTFQNLFS